LSVKVIAQFGSGQVHRGYNFLRAAIHLIVKGGFHFARISHGKRSPRIARTQATADVRLQPSEQ